MSDIIDYKLNIIYKYIIHIADIHIRNEDGNINSRFDEYQTVFNNLLNNIKQKEIHCEELLIAIAGDIFHDARKEKGRTTANAVLLFKNLIEELSKYGTIVIIPGNHDNNITFQNNVINMTDTLSSIFKGIKGLDKNIFYLRNTGIYKLGNCLFYTASVFDLDCIKGVSNYSERQSLLPSKLQNIDISLNHICLIHCGVQSQRLSNGHLLKDYEYSLEDLKDYDITLLGDTHEHQFLGEKQNIAYPSSLIQQNYGESLHNHGYILWDLQEKKGTFHEVTNDYGFITLNLKDNIDVNNILFPKKSRILIKDKNNSEEFIHNLKLKVEEKTEIIEWKIKKYLYTEKTENDVIENMNDVNIFQKYLQTKYEIDSKEYLFISQKIKDSLQKSIYTGNNRWNLEQLIVNNFQKYKGNYTLLDFTDISENQIVSILGENASGKSTIGRALSYIIWGKDIYNLDSYVNNESTNMNCVLKFIYNNQKYEIYREYQNKNSKESLKLFKFENEQKINITESHKTHTQEKIIKIFGSREDAKITWLCEQNSSTDFLNNNNNVELFTKIVGIDHFIEEYNNHLKIKNNLIKDKKDIQKEIKLLCNFDIDNELENTIEKLETEIESIKNDELEIENKINIENEKRKYGTQEEYLDWKENYGNNDQTIKNLETEKIGIDDTLYSEKITNYENKLKGLQKEKEGLLINIQKIDTELMQSVSITSLETEIKKYNITNQIDNQEEYDNVISKISILDNDIKSQIEIKNKKDKLQSDIENIVIVENNYSEEIPKIQKEIDNLETEIKINESFLKNFKKINYQKLITEKKKIQTIIVNYQNNIEIHNDKIDDLEKNIINISEEIEFIEEQIQKLINLENKNENNKNKLKMVLQNIEYNQNNLDKYKHIEFNDNCICCQNNIKYYKIDVLKNNITELINQKNNISVEISKNNVEIEKLLVYKDKKKQIESNQNIKTEIELLDRELIYIKDSIILNKDKLDNLEKEIENYNQNKDRKKINEKLITKKNEYSEKLDTYQQINDENEKKNKLKIEIINEIQNIEKQILSEKEIQKIEEVILNYNNQINHYKITQKIIDYYHNLNIEKENKEIMEKIDRVSKQIKDLQNNIKDLNIKYNSDKKINNEIHILINKNKDLDIKISNFKYYDPIILEKYLITKKDINENLINKSSILYYQKNKLEEYNKNREKVLQLKISEKELEDQIYLLENYISILDPVKGYPKNLMDTNLQTLTDKVNQFVHFAGFQYKTEFKCPEIKEGNKNKKKKLVISHKKDNKYFSKLSGAEEFTFNLATLTALGQMSNISNSPVLFIDEGFSSLDENHLNQIEDILNHLKHQFKYILNISHIKSIHNYADIKMEISNGKIIKLF